MNKYTTKDFIEKARKVHGNKYDYNKVEYINNHTKVCIICPIHGEFWQKPNDHLSGYGCAKCNQSYLEKNIKKLLNENKINYNEQQKFDWLKYKQALSLDFYLLDYNVAIECQGIQHHKPIDYFGGEKEFNKIVIRDKIKNDLCKKHNIKLLYFNYNDDIKIFNEKLWEVLEFMVLE